jgi:hypothetical protein
MNGRFPASASERASWRGLAEAAFWFQNGVVNQVFHWEVEL